MPLSEAQFAREAEPFRADMEALAARVLGPDAEDAVADTLLAALACHEKYDPQTGAAGLSRMLHAVLHCQIRRYMRERERQSALLSDLRWTQLSGLADEHRPDPHPAMAAEARLRLRTVMLSPLQQACLVGRLNGVPAKRTARELGLRVPDVYKHVKRAVLHLRACKSAALLEEADLDTWQWRAMWHVTVYHPPTPTGRALDREKLAKMH